MKQLQKLLVEQGLINSNTQLHKCYGGDVHRSFAAIEEGQTTPDLFVKCNAAVHSNILDTEFASLISLSKLVPFHYPKPIAVHHSNNLTFLCMPFYQLAKLSGQGAAQAGEMLATQHSHTAPKFGWDQTNYIGLSTQTNGWEINWSTFFWRHRLEPQLKMAEQQGLSKEINVHENHLKGLFGAHFTNHNPVPALLHGDLWAGNVSFALEQQTPIFYDPAPYYGDAETDIAMSELFGGFPNSFYSAYYAIRPKSEGYEQRRDWYNLYHAINHFNLFGATYSSLVEQLYLSITTQN